MLTSRSSLANSVRLIGFFNFDNDTKMNMQYSEKNLLLRILLMGVKTTMTRILRILCFYQSIHVRIEELWRLWGSYLGSSRLPSIALSSHCRLSHEVAQVRTSKWLIIRRPIYCVKNTTSNIICRVRLSYLTIASVFVGSIHSPHLLFSCRHGNTVPLHFVKFEKIGSRTEFDNII